MKTALCSLIFILLLGLPLIAGQSAPQVAAVRISLSDSYGQIERACSVKGFTSFDEGERPDYASHFAGLVGQDVPFGQRFRVILQCAGNQVFGPFWVAVDRPDKFIPLASWSHRGDYFTGAEPRLTVSVLGRPLPQTSESWVKLVGVYLDDQEVDQVDPRSGSARFYDPVPGRYLVLLLRGGDAVCTEQIDILGPGARMSLSPLSNDCKLTNPVNLRTAK